MKATYLSQNIQNIVLNNLTSIICLYRHYRAGKKNKVDGKKSDDDPTNYVTQEYELVRSTGHLESVNSLPDN